MNIKTILIVYTIKLFIANQLIAQQVVSTELPNQKQLPMAQINRVFQDSEGYMWYGTRGGGLCRDDGYTIETFRSDFNDPDMLESNWITCITEDIEHRIWFGTSRGLYILDKKDYQIHRLKDKDIEHWKIDAVLAASDSTIWVSTGSQAFRYNTNEEKLNTFSVKWEGQSRTITQFYEDNLQNIWIIQWRGGLFKFDPGTNTFINFLWPFNVSPTYIIHDLLSEKYWISTWGSGIVSFAPEEEDISKRYSFKASEFVPRDYSQRHILGMVQDTIQGNIWTITSDNLYNYKISTNGKLAPLETSSYLPKGKKLFNQIIADRNGNVWVPCDYPHSFIISINQKQTCIKNIPEMEDVLGLPAAPVVFVYDNGYYWFWQRRTGLYLYNSNNGELQFASHSPGLFSKRKSPVLEKAKHDEGIFTVLNDTIIILIEHDQGKISLPKELVELPSFERIHTMHADGFNNLWIGTSYNLLRYDLQNRKLHYVCKDIGVINDIISTSDGKVFIATEKQGFCQVSENGTILDFGKNEDFTSVTIAPNQVLWSGTNQGNVYYLNPDNDELISIREVAGLNGDAILAMEVNSSGYIWILTNQRIVIYNPLSKSTNIIHNSDPSIAMNNFLSLYRNEKGIIYVGGAGGFCVFPSYTSFNNSDTELPIKLTSVNVQNTSRLIGYNDKKIVLLPDEKNIELYFSTLDPLNAAKTRYAFRFKGEKTYWNYLPEGQNSFYLTGLSRGAFVLEVKATEKNGQWINQITEIHINRLPAWYETTWAFLAYAFLAIVFISLIFYFYLEWKKRKLINEQIRNSAIDLQELVNQLSGDFVTPSSAERLNMKDLLLNLKEILQRQKEESSPGPIAKKDEKLLSVSDEKFIQQALNYVEQNMDNTEYSVEQLSKDLGLDRTGIYRKLVSIIGKTPTSFIRSIRLKRAARLLDEGYTVAETADRVGFGTSSYLSKCFREEFGVKPSEYIHSLKNKNYNHES